GAPTWRDAQEREREDERRGERHAGGDAGLDLVRMGMPRVVRTTRVDPSAIEVEEAVEHDACPDGEQRDPAGPPEYVGAQGPPEPERERYDQQAGEVCADPVVNPRAPRGDRPEVGDVVVRDAVGGRLREPTSDPADVRRHEGDEAADSCNPSGHGQLSFE